MTIFDNQFRAILLILLVVLLRSLFLYKLPKKILTGLWAVVLLRLFIPYTQSVAAGFSLPNLHTLLRPLLQDRGPAVDSAHSAATLTAFAVPWYLLAAWLAGGILLAAYFIVGHIRGKKIYRFACPVEREDIRQWLRDNRIHRKIRILQCDEVSSALTYGLVRPVILLPSAMDFGDEEHVRFVLTHEMAHIRHFDVVWKWLSAAVLCLYWYNPMVWVMVVLLNRDIELHCDEQVLKKLGITKKTKSEYALTLIALAEQKKGILPLAGHFSRSATEERVLSIMHSRYAPVLFTAIALLGIALIGALSFMTFVNEIAGIAFTLPLT